MGDAHRNRSDFDFLLANAEAAQAVGLVRFGHLDQPIGILNYIRIADDIADQLPRGDLLDWGCGFGQMTYLLSRRGLQVRAFDVRPNVNVALPNIPLCREVDVVRSTDPTVLPFPEESFDAVLSCGVLEHVEEGRRPGNEVASLTEIARVLRPGGFFFIYQLPQRYSWQESIQRILNFGSYHQRLYEAKEITGMLRDAGFSVRRLRRANFVGLRVSAYLKFHLINRPFHI